MDIFNSQNRIIKKTKPVYNIEEMDFVDMEILLEKIFEISIVVVDIDRSKKLIEFMVMDTQEYFGLTFTGLSKLLDKL